MRALETRAVLVILLALLAGFAGPAGAQVPVGKTHTLFASLASDLADVCANRPQDVTPVFCGMEVTDVALLGPNGEKVVVKSLRADTAQRRAAGFQEIAPETVARAAIFFEFENDTAGAFHMCNVSAPLDIIWLRSDGRVLDAQTMQPGGRVPPSVCTQVYAPRRFGAYRYALEVPAGALAEFGIDLASPFAWRLDL